MFYVFFFNLIIIILGAVEHLVRKADMMFDNETNNRAELFMSLVAKYNAGKRLNLTMKGSFQTRCSLASMQYNQGPDWILNSWRKTVQGTPCKNLKTFVAKKRRITNYVRSQPSCKRRLWKKSRTNNKNNDYGVHALEPELDEDEFEKEKKRILTSMQVNVTESNKNAEHN